MSSGFPFIKLVSAENMVGFSESQKISYLNKVFTDSYKSPLSCIVVDGLERILGKPKLLSRTDCGILSLISVQQTGSRSALASRTVYSKL